MSKPAERAPVPTAIASDDVRLKRLLWRATHRGSKELDLMIGGFARANAPTMAAAELDQLETLLETSEPDLTRWLLDPNPAVPDEFKPLIDQMRAFHGLGGER